MEACYITGHRNPDMDSVCSAYAYSVLLNTVFRNGEIKYVPVRLGPVSDSVKKVFEELSIPLPDVLKDVRCKVSDVMRRGSLSLKSDDPIYELVLLYNKAHPSVVPIEKDGDVIGLISVDDINRFFLKENHKERPNYIIREENIQRVVGGHFYKRGEQKTFQNSIIVGAMEYDVFVKRAEKCPTKPFLVVGNRKRHIEYAVEHDFPGIILTGVDDIDRKFFAKKAVDNNIKDEKPAKKAKKRKHKKEKPADRVRKDKASKEKHSKNIAKKKAKSRKFYEGVYSKKAKRKSDKQKRKK